MEKAGMEPTREGRTGEALRSAAEGAKQEASRLGEEVKHRGTSMLEEQREHATHQISSVAKALDAGASSFEEDGQESLARYTRRAAEGVRRFNDDLGRRDFEAILDSTRSYARENPAVVIGGAAILGFAISRLLKSSSERDHEYEDEALETSSVTTEPSLSTPAQPFEGMSAGATSVGEPLNVADTERRSGDGTNF